MSKSCLSEVAGVITLYNSEPEVLSRIDTYINQIGKLYVIDNSDKPNVNLVSCIIKLYPKVSYINNFGNLGVAYALNVGATAAAYDQYKYLLMMDDDSEASSQLVIKLYNVFIKHRYEKIGIVAAKSDNAVNKSHDQNVITVITSGSMLCLKAYKEVGPFLDELFIDWVDHEYCFRLQSKGYRVLLMEDVNIKHRLGTYYDKKLFGLIKVKWRSHNPARLYYKFRNSLFVIYKYKHFLPTLFVISVFYEMLQDVAKVIFLESNKTHYLAQILKGISHAISRRLGKLPS